VPQDLPPELGVPAWLSAQVMRLLQKKKSRRPQSAQELAEALRSGAQSRAS